MAMTKNAFSSINVLDHFAESDSLYTFDKMLVPNRIFEYMQTNNELSGSIAENYEYLLYIINTIYRRYQIAFNIAMKHGWPIDLTRWAVPIYSRIYNRIIGSNYLKYVKILIQMGIIGRSDSYIKGTKEVKGKCKHYWFTSDFLLYVHRYLITKNQETSGDIPKRQGGVRVIKISNPRLYRRLSLHAEEVKKEQMSLPQIRELYEDLQHFSIDKDKSHRILSDMVSKNKISAERMSEELHKVDAFDGYVNDPYSIYCKRDAYGRVHTNITQIKKEVRKNCILCDGRPTVGIDIKSSQGAFLYKVFDNFISHYDGREHIVDSYIDMKFDYSHYSTLFTSSFIKTFHSDLSSYRSLLVSGSLYEHFLSFLNDSMCLSCDRSEVKKEFLTCLFCGPFFSHKKHRLVKAIQYIWKAEFPSLYKVIQLIKYKNHTALAHELQRTESHLVFGIVYKNIKNNLHCPVCTVHDSIIVDERYASAAKKIFDDALSNIEIPTFTEEERMEFGTSGDFLK